MTGAFGLSDPTVARRRCDADLAVLNEYLQRYEGMKQACLEQLAWGPERYAQLPPKPTLLDVESKSNGAFLGIIAALLAYFTAYVVVLGAGLWLLELSGLAKSTVASTLLAVALLGMYAPPVFAYRWTTELVKRQATKTERHENSRRQREYQEALAQSLRDAQPRKAAEGHRLRLQIRELESLAKTVAEREAAVSRLRGSL